MSTSLDDQIKCVKREIRMRERVYPNWVTSRRMSREEMNKELEGMKAVLKTLEGLMEQARQGSLGNL